MKALANYLKLSALLLCASVISGSSNKQNSIGFWQVLHAKANVIDSYWQFPRYFANHILQLPTTALATLARNKIADAQYGYGLSLLSNNQTETAKLFWQASLDKITRAQQKKLADSLFSQQRWQDLALLKNQNKLPKGDIFYHLQLQQQAPIETLSASFMNKLGFLLASEQVEIQKQCTFNVLMLSDHRDGLYRLNQFRNAYFQNPEPSLNTFCFSKPVYVGSAISCNSTESSRAKCNWQQSSLKKRLPTGFDFAVMMPKQGTASVKNGLMHINSQASYAVFLHELMHFNGFEDEYALPAKKQAWLCQLDGFVAPNLFIAKKSVAPKGWHKSQSCQQGGTAYKPSAQWSIMQYQQLGLSAQYRVLWQTHIALNADLFVRF
ncbi:hypothetical protein PUND_a2759 [Pseudoalteromonas undina]|uniref:Orphan protein n=1 Tax=Pseudoalteromonas undina TaxID=43660 RepID=A0ABN0NKH6_9GAMM|nr:hypothetical protein [Pseudoalteromonas undina]KAF7766868.1 hypothetical protein PUND_a2759 [Pseudoalteromonas undina]